MNLVEFRKLWPFCLTLFWAGYCIADPNTVRIPSWPHFQIIHGSEKKMKTTLTHRKLIIRLDCHFHEPVRSAITVDLFHLGRHLFSLEVFRNHIS